MPPKSATQWSPTEVGLNDFLHAIAQAPDHDFRREALGPLVIGYVDGPRVLDAGCGYGFTAIPLSRQGHEVVINDISSTAIDSVQRQASALDLDIEAHVVAIEDLPGTIEGDFDNFLCLDVIEHIEDDARALRALVSMLRIGGRGILTVPAGPFLFGMRDRHIGHFRRYTRQGLFELVSSCGLEPEIIRYWNWLGVAPYFIFERLLKRELYDLRLKQQHEDKAAAMASKLLRRWLLFENKIRPPFGLSLVVVGRRVS